MSTQLLIPFAIQLLLAVGAFFIAPVIASASKAVWASASIASIGVLLLWPLMRVFPVQPINLLTAQVVACIELTGLAVPGVLFFGIASRHVPRKSDQRAILLLTAVAGLYFVKAGWWMLAPGVPELGRTNIDPNGVCRQSTGYTCVAASMVTMLHAHGVAAEETEMARLAHTQVGGGATDSRTLWALQRKLDERWEITYQRLDERGIIGVSKPCLVQLDWGYFVSHMVPVMSATSEVVVIGDPLNGVREMTMSEFMRKWKGTAISITPPP